MEYSCTMRAYSARRQRNWARRWHAARVRRACLCGRMCWLCMLLCVCPVERACGLLSCVCECVQRVCLVVQDSLWLCVCELSLLCWLVCDVHTFCSICRHSKPVWNMSKLVPNFDKMSSSKVANPPSEAWQFVSSSTLQSTTTVCLAASIWPLPCCSCCRLVVSCPHRWAGSVA